MEDDPRALEDELAGLCRELEEVEASGLECLPEYGYSTKEEVLDQIRSGIAAIEERLEEAAATYDYTEEELEHERMMLCMSQGIPRYC